MIDYTISTILLFIRFIVCLFFIHKVTYAQNTVPLRFESISIDNGLSQGFVNDILQDKQGFMWFVTSDGLNKYDGSTITTYNHDLDDSTSIGSNDLSCIFEDSQGRLWIGTRDNGLNYFDRQTNNFYRLRYTGPTSIQSNYIVNVTEDKTGALWIRTDTGIDRLAISSRKKQVAQHDNNFFLKHELLFTHIDLHHQPSRTKEQHYIEKVFVDSKNRILIISRDTIWEIIYNTSKKIHRLVKRFSFVITDPNVSPDLIDDTSNHCFLFNIGKIIQFQNYDFNSVREIYSKSSLPWTIDKDNRLWFTCQNDIMLMHLKSGDVTRAITSDSIHMNVMKTALSFYTDRSGVLWIGSTGYGILKHDPEKELFHHILPQLNPYQLLEHAPGELITNKLEIISLTANGPYKVRPLLDRSLFKKKFSVPNTISFAKDRIGNYWIGGRGGIIKYSIKNSKAVRYTIPSDDLMAVPYPIFADSANNIWMGFNQYLVCYNTSLNKFTKFSYPTNISFYENLFLQCIYQDNDILWLGTSNGMFSFDMNQMRFNQYHTYRENDSTSLSHNFIYSFCNDVRQPETYLWVGTKGGGLNLLNKRTGKFSRFNTKKGLANNVVYGILPDEKGNLWVSTNKGLSVFDAILKRFINFRVNDGLQSNEFNRFSYCKMESGILAFGGVNGINYFDPSTIEMLKAPTVVFTEFRLFNKTVTNKQPDSPLTKDIGYTDHITLPHNQNVLTFRFAAMDYRKIGRIKYRYRMEEFDKNWIYSGTVQEATYTNLDPGNYRFIVQASFENGMWGKHYSTISLRIVPPWWRTWWFYILATSATIASIYLLIRYRLQQLLRVENLRNAIARDLHDEVGSSISTVAIYSKIALEQLGSSTFNNEPLLQKITEQAAEIMESMNDIVWNVNTRNDSFDNILNRMREHAYQLFEAKGYILHFDFDENLRRMKLDMGRRKDFYLIYKEALNNIVKYANGENIWISVHTKVSIIKLTIKDDGKGFDINTVKSRSNGLINMNHRASALKGQLHITSAPGQGTTLELSF